MSDASVCRTTETNSDLSFYSDKLTTDEGNNDDHTIEGIQKKFLNMVKICDVSSVKELLDNHKGKLILNCKNYQGLTGLTLAVQVKCEPMVDLLLSQPGLEIGDSLMHAIRENHYSIVIKILDILQSKFPGGINVGFEHSTEFPSYLTPLMLAAQCGHFKIISLLLKRGHVIQIPHKPQCLCQKVCKSTTQLKNGLGVAELRLSVFRALTNPAYITLTSEDPILNAFLLSKSLGDHGNVDRIFKSDYELLSFQTRMFAVHLIGLCRSSIEVELILTRKEGCKFSGSFPYHRLVMAMDLKQKEFVAHAYVQQILEIAWTGSWYEWRRYGSVLKSSMVFPRIFMLPYIVFLYLVLPYSNLGQHYALPVNRMLNYLASYAIFLMVLTYENNVDKTGSTDYTSCCVLKIIIFVYVASFIIRTVKLIIFQGFKRYFSLLWNIYDCVKLSIFVMVFICWWLVYAKTKKVNESKPVERKYWKSSDPELVAEGLLAVATVMSYLQLLFLCQLSYSLGPMQVSLGKMTTDFARFAMLFSIVILAFTAGLCRFYQYYDGMAKIDPDTGYKVVQDESFINVYSTLKTLFWGIFCLTSPTAGSVVIESSLVDELNEVADNHYITQAIGTILYAVFETLSVIIMLNMLIATMTNTFQRVTGNSYIEWVFGRTQVFLSFSVHTELPPPLNLLPTSHCFTETKMYRSSCCTARYDPDSVENTKPYRVYENSEYSKEEFRALMGKLVRRYFREKLTTSFVRKCRPFCH